MRSIERILMICCVIAVTATAVLPAQLFDLNRTKVRQPGSNPTLFAQVGPWTYFRAAHPTFGLELFRTRGTPATTTLVADITPNGDSFFTALTPFGSRLALTLPRELWQTDGTAAGTSRVIGNEIFGAANGLLLYTRGTPAHGIELWFTDGSPAGTRILRDIRPGPQSSAPLPLGTFKGRVFFAADDGVHGREIWVTDGTAVGTRLFRDLAPNGSSPAVRMVSGDHGFVFLVSSFSAPTPAIWWSDGTAAGTVKLKDVTIFEGDLREAVTFRGGLYFVMDDDPTINRRDRLWRTDGTAAGTKLVARAPAGLRQLSAAPGRIYFIAARKIWQTDGHNAAPIESHDGGDTSEAENLVTHRGVAYFIRRIQNGPPHLWRTDGTAKGTIPVDLPLQNAKWAECDEVATVGGRLWLSYDDGCTGLEPWVWDGFPMSPTLVANIVPPTTATDDSNPSGLTHSHGTLFFQADDGVLGYNLWRSDGTHAGTYLIGDVLPRSDTQKYLFPAADKLFILDDYQLAVSDGTRAGTRLVASHTQRVDAWPDGAAVVNGTLFYAGHDPIHGVELWRSDGTVQGTTRVKDIVLGAPGSYPTRFFADAGRVYFVAFDGTTVDLWVSDGTTGGTRKIPNTTEALPRAAFRGNLYYFWSGGVYRSDGTAAGTTLVFSGYAESFATSPDLLYLTDLNRNLWATDGTRAGNRQLTTIRAGYAFAASSNGLFFIGDEPTTGEELWFTDGTPGGTRLVREIGPGPSSASIAEIVAGGDRVFFLALGVPWVSDGTAAGTKPVSGVTPSTSAGGVYEIAIAGGRLFFPWSTPQTGLELQALDPAATAVPVGRPYTYSAVAPLLRATSPVLGRPLELAVHRTQATRGWLVLSAPLAAPYRVTPDVFAYVDPSAAAWYALGTSNAFRVVIPLPVEPRLIGASFAAQAIVTPSPTPLGFSVTDGLQLTLGR